MQRHPVGFGDLGIRRRCVRDICPPDPKKAGFGAGEELRAGQELGQRIAEQIIGVIHGHLPDIQGRSPANGHGVDVHV